MSFKRNRSMLNHPTEVFEAVVNGDDKKPPLPLIGPNSANPPLILLTLSKSKR